MYNFFKSFFIEVFSDFVWGNTLSNDMFWDFILLCGSELNTLLIRVIARMFASLQEADNSGNLCISAC